MIRQLSQLMMNDKEQNQIMDDWKLKMDWDLLESYGIKKLADPQVILELLENQQNIIIGKYNKEVNSKIKSEVKAEHERIQEQINIVKPEALIQNEKNSIFDTITSVDVDEITLKDAEIKNRIKSLKKVKGNYDENSYFNNRHIKETDTSKIIKADLNSGKSNDEDTGKTQTKTQNDQNNKETITSDTNNQELKQGILNFKAKDYDASFKIFFDLAQKGNSEAEYYLAMQYTKGLGTEENKSKALFWLKKAADLKYAEAQYFYALTKMSGKCDTQQEFLNGMKYLELAADQGYQPAMKRHIDIILQGYEDDISIKKAIVYSSKLQSLLSDQYDIDVYKKKEEELKNSLEDYKKRKIWSLIKYWTECLTPIFLIFGFIYLLGGAHPEEWNKNEILKLLPDASTSLIINYNPFWKLIPPILDTNGRLGIELITLSFICSFYYSYIYKQSVSNIISKISYVIVGGIIIWHFILVISEKKTFYEGVFEYFLAIIVCRVFSNLITFFIKTVHNLNTIYKRIVIIITIVLALIILDRLFYDLPSFKDITVVNPEETKVNNSENSDMFSAEIVDTDVSKRDYVTVGKITADSSLISSSGITYGPDLMVDGDIQTSWQEGEGLSGLGKTITVKFIHKVRLGYILIYNGNQKSEKSFKSNNRICSMKIKINDQDTEVELKDTETPQVIKLNNTESSWGITIEIVSVYRGDIYDDTCISELKFIADNSRLKQ